MEGKLFIRLVTGIGCQGNEPDWLGAGGSGGAVDGLGGGGGEEQGEARQAR